MFLQQVLHLLKKGLLFIYSSLCFLMYQLWFSAMYWYITYGWLFPQIFFTEITKYHDHPIWVSRCCDHLSIWFWKTYIFLSDCWCICSPLHAPFLLICVFSSTASWSRAQWWQGFHYCDIITFIDGLEISIIKYFDTNPNYIIFMATRQNIVNNNPWSQNFI